jgi:amino acid transporter, AAT family
MAAIMITTAFTSQFRMTLVYGLAFMVVLVATYMLWYRKR